LVACCLCASGHFIAGIVLFLLSYLFDFTTRRCPACGMHISITLNRPNHCPHCGKELE
jgi:transposase